MLRSNNPQVWKVGESLKDAPHDIRRTNQVLEQENTPRCESGFMIGPFRVKVQYIFIPIIDVPKRDQLWSNVAPSILHQSNVDRAARPVRELPLNCDLLGGGIRRDEKIKGKRNV